jgi:hypothetical protein
VTIRSTLTSLLLCVVLLSSVAAAEPEPVPPAALPATFLPLVTSDGVARDLSVAAIEITQSTQTAANSVPLVAGRATVARVYAVSSGEPVPGVVVSLAATRNGVPLMGSPVRAAPKTVSRSPSRVSYDASFNLLLPQAWLSGTITLVATVDAAGTVAESDEANNRASTSISFGVVPPLDIKIVPIRYTHLPNGRTYPAPTVDTVSQWAMKSFPLQSVRVSFRAPLDYSGDLSDGAAWEQLLDRVTTVRLAEGAPAPQIYYALVPTQNGADRWFKGGVAGIGWVGMRAAVSLDFGPGQEEKTGRIAAHEIGHNLRRYHAPCGTSGDPRQPFPYPGGSIGADVFGLDIANGRVWSPAAPDAARDVMSYCTPQWVSDFTYTALYHEQRSSGMAAVSTAGDALLVRAVLDHEGATLLPVYAVSEAAPIPASPSEYTVELLNPAGEVAVRHTVEVVQAETPHGFGEAHDHAGHTHAEGEGMRRIHALVPLPGAPVAAVRLVRGTAILGTYHTENTAKRSALSSVPAVISVANGLAELRWEPAATPALVRATADGTRWTVLGVDVTGGSLTVEAALLSGMTRIEVTPAGTAPFELPLPKRAALPDAPPQVWIHGPHEAKAGEPALLYGQATDAEDGALDELHWTLDGLAVSGTQTLQLGALDPGSYTVTLAATDSAGQHASASHTLTVLP